MDTEITHANLIQSCVGEHTTKNESTYIRNYFSIDSISRKKVFCIEVVLQRNYRLIRLQKYHCNVIYLEYGILTTVIERGLKSCKYLYMTGVSNHAILIRLFRVV